jgi:PPM family protein phosphatase
MTSTKSVERDMIQFHGPADTGSWDDSSAAFAVTAAGKTDRGLVRDGNEDQFLIAELAKLLRVEQSTLPEAAFQTGAVHGHVFLVADGMGGHVGGEIASRIAAHTVEEFMLNSLKWFLQSRGDEGREVVERLHGAVVEADTRVLNAAKRQPELTGMGSTLTLALAVGRTLFIAHVGDSRAYLLRNEELQQLTEDHTLANELIARGALQPGEPLSPRLKHVITNAIGGSDTGVRVEVTRATLEPGDRLLLCTDGLTDLLDDDTIATVLTEHPTAAEACDRLVEMANDRGGHDNVTAVVATFSEPLEA